jgi:hypothetical protein
MSRSTFNTRASNGCTAAVELLLQPASQQASKHSMSPSSTKLKACMGVVAYFLRPGVAEVEVATIEEDEDERSDRLESLPFFGFLLLLVLVLLSCAPLRSKLEQITPKQFGVR